MTHLAIIADGNRRWARKNDLPAELGHAQGLTMIENTCVWAIEKGIPYLTMFCLSTENWNRSREEVNNLLSLARSYFTDRRDWYVNRGIKVIFCGRRDRLPTDILISMDNMASATRDGSVLTLVICVDYGGRDEIARAVAYGAVTETSITEALTRKVPEPDLILRTGGRHRISNFMLWQAAYSEIYFSDTLFPALTDSELDSILAWFDNQVRTFGK